jgi:hypothetical protein
MNALSNLIGAMRSNDDLTSTAINPDKPVILAPAPASAGTNAPMLEEWVTALFIMNGVQARWVINYWLVANRAGAESGIPAVPTYDQVIHVINDLARRTAKRT